MKRLMSTLALSAWGGFLAVTGMWHGWQAFEGPGATELARRFPAIAEVLPDFTSLPYLAPQLAMISCLACLAAAGMIFMGVAKLHGPQATGPLEGERFALSGLSIAGLTALGAWIAGRDIAPLAADGVFLAALLATLAALAFDRLVTVDDEPEDSEAHFQAAIAVIAQQMAQQTLRYTPDGTSGDRGSQR